MLDLAHVGRLRVAIEELPHRLAGVVTGLGEGLSHETIVGAFERGGVAVSADVLDQRMHYRYDAPIESLRHRLMVLPPLWHADQHRRRDLQLQNLIGPFVNAADAHVDQVASLDQFAAQIAAIDEMICVSNSGVHLAGALGIPVWLALQQVPDWRWLLEREDSPWYPTLRLFRQTGCDYWHDVFERMAAELRQVVSWRLTVDS
jgi:hypothetical protein